MNNLAPIVLFVYNRPWHTKQTIEALQKNELASESELFIHSDEFKDEESRQKVEEVRKYIKTIKGFKKVRIIEREKNWGLADSIIDGVTKIVNGYGKIIVLEDDIVTSPYFLKFMNEALGFYENEKKVWHISGWNYPIRTEGLKDVFLWRLMNCWGWATWKDRWQCYEKNAERLKKEFTKDDIKRFNLDGTQNFWTQVELNIENKINTWAIFWYATIFQKSGLCLNPSKTFVENIGIDNSGVHSGGNDILSNDFSNARQVNFSVPLEENSIALEKIKEFYRRRTINIIRLFINKILRKFINK